MPDGFTSPNLNKQSIEAKLKPRGHLKVFLGYAIGVGKTFAMLEAAHQRTHEGTDVVVGIVESHKRRETEALLRGLEMIPPKVFRVEEVKRLEMDIDAVLKRQPQLVLVDDLAHTNAEGSRHTRRYQDILELLEAGLDVYTTLNIHHLESLSDVVEKITGMKVRATIPDGILDASTEIELIDLPPDELIQRLKTGKVRMPGHDRQANEKFFRTGNLTALRELTLRHAASIGENSRIKKRFHLS